MLWVECFEIHKKSRQNKRAQGQTNYHDSERTTVRLSYHSNGILQQPKWGQTDLPMAGRIPNGGMNFAGGLTNGGGGHIAPLNFHLPERRGKLKVTVTAKNEECYKNEITIK